MRWNFRIEWIWLGCWILLSTLVSEPIRAQAWKTDVLIEGRDPVVSQHGMVWDETGQLHLILTGDNRYHLWYDGQAWQKDMEFPDDIQAGYAWAAPGTDGTLHFISKVGSYLRYHTVTASGWDSVYIDYAYNTSNICPLIFDSLGNPHTVFSEYNGDIVHAVFRDDKWTNEVVACSDTAFREAGFDLDDRGYVNLCFVADGELKFRKFKGSTWHEETVLTGTPTNLMMKLDDQGIPHIVYLIYDSTDYQLGYSTKTGDGWVNEIIEPCSSQGTLLLDDNNTPHVFCSSGGLKHYFRDDNQWDADTIDPDDTYQPYVSAGFDPDGRLTACAVNTGGRYVTVFRLNEQVWEGEKVLETGKISGIRNVIDRHDVIHGIMMNSGAHQLEYGTIKNGSWVSEILVPDMMSDAGQLSIGIDGSDHIHCCYADNRINGLVHGEKTSAGWVSESVCEDCYFRASQMAVANNGDLAVIASSGIELLLFQKIQGVWSTTCLGTGDYGAVSICMDSKNAPHAIFSRKESNGYSINNVCYYIFQDDGIWTEEKIHETSVGSGLEQMVIAMDSADIPRILKIYEYWTHYAVRGWFYSIRDDQGWHGQQYSYSSATYSISLCVNEEDRSFISYNYSTHLRLLMETDTTSWLRSEMGGFNQNSARDMTFMVDSTGRFHLLNNCNDGLNYVYLPLPEAGVRLEMPAQAFSYGDTCYLHAYMRHDESPLLHAPFCLLLEYQGNYWFWPDWRSTFCNVYVDVWRPGSIVSIIPGFTWNYNASGDKPGAEGMVFWAALLNEDMTEIIGGMDGLGRWEFSYY
ncbi:hypothetical protein JW823_09385 [bacterium]|nr:hypothetical protein [candidate division CSSED10-310 bacterium]